MTQRLNVQSERSSRIFIICHFTVSQRNGFHPHFIESCAILAVWKVMEVDKISKTPMTTQSPIKLVNTEDIQPVSSPTIQHQLLGQHLQHQASLCSVRPPLLPCPEITAVASPEDKRASHVGDRVAGTIGPARHTDYLQKGADCHRSCGLRLSLPRSSIPDTPLLLGAPWSA